MCKQAFQALKYALTHAVVLRLLGFNLLFVVKMDASDFAIGGVLTQAYQPVTYFSMILNSSKHIYPIHDRKLLAVIEAYKWWRTYLTG